MRDAEVVRHALVPKDTLGGRWTILGQSFGGFCCLTYLSIAPQGAFWRGGIRPCHMRQPFTGVSRWPVDRDVLGPQKNHQEGNLRILL